MTTPAVESSRRRPWQFSLRAIFILMLIVASFCAGWASRSAQLARVMAEAQMQRDRAEVSHQMALEVVDQLMVQAAEKADLQATTIEASRQKLLEEARDFYEGASREKDGEKAPEPQTAGANNSAP